MNIQLEGLCRAGYVGRGAELPCPLQVHHSPHASTCSLTQKLSEPHTIGIFMESSLCRHDQFFF